MTKKHILFVVTLLLTATCVLATTSTDTDFSGIVTTLTNWSEGTLGKTIAMSMFLVGIAIGVIQQSVIAIVVDVAAGLLFVYGPTVIINVFGALI